MAEYMIQTKWTLFSPTYFVVIAIWMGSLIGLYLLGRDKSKKWQFNLLYGISIANFILHFLKLVFPPYVNEFFNYDDLRALRVIGAENICAVNTLLMPWLLKSKNKYALDYLFFIGAFGGFMAVFVPVSPYTTREFFSFDMFRYFFCHMSLVNVPILMVFYKLHKIEYKRAWAVPFSFFLCFLTIYLNENLTYDFGWIPAKRNFSFVYGPNEQLQSTAKFFLSVVPNSFKYTPVGASSGEIVMAPLLWLIFPLLCFVLPYTFIISLFFDFSSFKNDMKSIFHFFKNSKEVG